MPDIIYHRPPSSMLYKQQPSYWQFFTDSYDYFNKNIWEFLLKENNRSEYFPNQFYKDLNRVYEHIIVFDIILILILSILWTLARHLSTKYIFIPLTKFFGLPLNNAEKVPESAWKLCFYFATWTSCSYYIFIYNNGEFFHDPSSVWNDYSLNNGITGFVYVVVVTEISFYIHSLYTTLFVDQRRKDTPTLMFHHVISVFLIWISYCNKSHKCGLVTIFLLDCCDILLEATKLIRYFKIQNGRSYDWMEIFVNIGFACFLITWLVNRLYWFPLKIIYFSSVYVERNQISVPFITIMVVMLWIILLMNFYWFSFALRLLYKVATRQIDELEDNREFEEEKADDECRSKKDEIVKSNDLTIEEKRKFSVDSGVDLAISLSERKRSPSSSSPPSTTNDDDDDDNDSSTTTNSDLGEIQEDSSATLFNDDASQTSASSAYNLRQRKKIINFQVWN